MSSADAEKVLRRVTEDDERERRLRERHRLDLVEPVAQAPLLVADALPAAPTAEPLQTGYAGLDDLLLHEADAKNPLN